MPTSFKDFVVEVSICLNLTFDVDSKITIARANKPREVRNKFGKLTNGWFLKVTDPRMAPTRIRKIMSGILTFFAKAETKTPAKRIKAIVVRILISSIEKKLEFLFINI